MTATVWVTHTFPAWHSWPGAPIGRSYLATDHRHLFHVRVELPVAHDDRDVEFHDLLDALTETCDAYRGIHVGGKSCEMLAREIGEALAGRLLLSTLLVSVSEDGEAGATVRIEA